MASLGRAGGARDFCSCLPPVLFLDFVVSHTFCVPEDAASLTLARDVTGNSKLARDCDRSELRPHLPKLRLVEQGTEDPEHRTSK